MTVLAIDVTDLSPAAAFELTAPLIIAMLALLVAAAALIGTTVFLSRPRRAPRKPAARGSHNAAGETAGWRTRIDDILRQHHDGQLGREQAFAALALVARDFATATSGRNLASSTLSDIARLPRTSSDRNGLELLRMTISALYPPEFADATLNAAARDTSVDEAAGWVSTLIERWGR